MVGGIPVATSTFNGSITLNGGTLVAAAVAGTSSTVLGNASNTRTISVNSGATLRFDAPNVLSQTWAQANVPTLAVNGGTVTNADPAATGGNNNALGNVSLTNGTLNASVGSHAGYGAWDINGTLSSSGTSFITSSDPTYGTVLLNSAGPGLAPASTTVNVADGSLTISAPLAQCSGSGDQRISGLIKTGAGTLTLSGANTYSGPTTVSAGTLALGASGTLPGATAVSIATATLDAATFSATAGTLAVTGNSTIHLGSGATLAFAGSSAIPWSGTLVLSGTFVSGVSLRFGTTSSGLASSQLALITGLGTLSLDGNGFLILNPYASWSGGAAFTADANGDGIANGLAWVLGAANPSANGQALMPVPGNEAGFLTLHFKRSHTLGSAHLYLEYSNDLSQSDPWHPVDLVNGPLGDIVLVDVPGSPTDDVTVKIPSTHASPAGRLFGRLHATEN